MSHENPLETFDGHVIDLGMIVYQLNNSPDNDTLRLLPYKVIDVSKKGKVELIFMNEKNEWVSRMDMASNVCYDHKFLIDHWITNTKDLIEKKLPERINRLEELKNNPPNLSYFSEYLGEGLEESQEI